MEELIEIMKEIRNGIYAINENIEQLKDEVAALRGPGIYDSISDVCDKLDSAVNDIKGNGVYDTISDIGEKLHDIDSVLNRIDINTM